MIHSTCQMMNLERSFVLSSIVAKRWRTWNPSNACEFKGTGVFVESENLKAALQFRVSGIRVIQYTGAREHVCSETLTQLAVVQEDGSSRLRLQGRLCA